MDSNVTERFAKAMDRDLKDVEALFEGLGTVIKENLIEMNSIALPGFGTFTPVKKEECVKEENGNKVLYPPVITVEFTSSALLRRKMSEEKNHE